MTEPRILHEWSLAHYGRIVESEPGCVHFEERSHPAGGSAGPWKEVHKSRGIANEMIRLAATLVERDKALNRLCDDVVTLHRTLTKREDRIVSLEAKVTHLKGLLCEFAVEHEDERMSYVTVQIDRDTWGELQALRGDVWPAGCATPEETTP